MSGPTQSLACHDPILLTPGPLTTSLRTRTAMLTDWGCWDGDFHALTAGVCERLLAIANGSDSHVCVPIQGSGTFAVEAAIGTFVPRDGKVLVLANGAYGRRIAAICGMLGRDHLLHEVPEDVPVSPDHVDRLLAADPALGHVVLVHCETSSGLLNPLEAVAAVVARHGRRLVVDAMSSFGALAIDASTLPFEAVIATSGKCLEGVPGLSFVLAKADDLLASAGNTASLVLDLRDQYLHLRHTGRWRFTPPTHVVAALYAALLQYGEAGGLQPRLVRYAQNCAALVDGMAALGLRGFLPPELQAPIIVAFHTPRDARYRFPDFYAAVRRRGFVLYPGRLAQAETFRVGCIGAIDASHMTRAVEAIADAMRALGIAAA